jgi:hypothetical protein
MSEPNWKVVGQHRRSKEQRRRAALRRVGGVALVVLTLVLGGLVMLVKPDTETSQRPFVVSGQVGRAVGVRTFDATVLEVTGATQVTQRSQVHTTSGVWVVVKLRAVARSKPVAIGYAALRDGHDRTYVRSDRVNQPLIGGRELQPGIPVVGQVVFEVPRDAATHLTVLLAPSSFMRDMDALAEVPLSVDKAQVDGWLAAKDPFALEEAKATT